MTPVDFVSKWEGVATRERQASQEHFIDLCRMLQLPTPNEADAFGNSYAFDKGAEKTSGGEGFADVWKQGHFAWEYKGKKKNLDAAYQQLLEYREALGNPPLLIVCDLNEFRIHTNFTGTQKVVHRFALSDFVTPGSEALGLLRAVFLDPERLRPTVTREQITEEAAARFSELAGRLRDRGHEAHETAHFLMKLLFCLFAEDVRLLPEGLLNRLIAITRKSPEEFTRQIQELFRKMSVDGGYFGPERIEWFNGGLFEDAVALPLTSDDLDVLGEAARLDWSNVEPAILGTLFERGLDPSKRSQLGAHYTDKASILRVVEPVVIAPLRREFESLKATVLQYMEASVPAPVRRRKATEQPAAALRAFLERLRNVRVLDPACGSGNFLYVTLQALKDLEKEVILWGALTIRTAQIELPGVGPQVVRGIEINPYATELARVTIWIGEIQWMIANGFGYRTNPILAPLETVECRDAVLDRSIADLPRKAAWPDAEFVVGNPPFLGGKKLRATLGDDYVTDLFRAYDGEVPREADLSAYWHERARQAIEGGGSRRAGLLATQGIRGGANQEVLRKIKTTGDIFFAWSNEPWVVEGAVVRISIVGQDNGSEVERALDGASVSAIYPDLTGARVGSAAMDLTSTPRLAENIRVAFMGDTKGGPFELSGATARQLLAAGPNPHGRPNSDVIVPWINSLDVTRRPRDMFIVDFGTDMTEAIAAQYEAPFEHVRREVMAIRAASRTTRPEWWLHERPRPDMRKALARLDRFIVTPSLAKHRVFTWARRPTLPDHQVFVFARDDDYAFGVLHSRAHHVWSLRKGTLLRIDPRYTPTTTFDTFPFPWPLHDQSAALSAAQKMHHAAIEIAAKVLDEQRSRWLNPPELIRLEPDIVSSLPARVIPLDDDAAAELGRRTLTKLYNARPTWLTHLHESLDRAVCAAYGWEEDVSDEDILRRLLALNHQRAGQI
jgi:type II restriction/modification system DNA methylase subunit YeeA